MDDITNITYIAPAAASSTRFPSNSITAPGIKYKISTVNANQVDLLFDRDFMGTIALDTQYAQAPTIDVSGVLVATLYATVLPAVINAAIGNTSVL